MEQSRGLIRCNHSDEMRMLGREGEGVMAGGPTQRGGRRKGRRQVSQAGDSAVQMGTWIGRDDQGDSSPTQTKARPGEERCSPH